MGETLNDFHTAMAVVLEYESTHGPALTLVELAIGLDLDAARSEINRVSGIAKDSRDECARLRGLLNATNKGVTT